MNDKTEDAKKWEAARGCGFLGLIDEAEAHLRAISRADPALYVKAQDGLCQLYQRAGRNEESVRIGMALIAAGQHTLGVVEDTMVSLCFLGRVREGREVLERVADFGRPAAFNAYQRACFDSLDGDFPGALRWLEIEARECRMLDARALGDSDLFGLWQWLASPGLGLEDSHRLLDLPLPGYCAEALDPRHELLLDQNDLKQQQPEFRQLYKFDRNAGLLALHPLTAAQNPEFTKAFFRTRRAHLANIVALIETGYRHAFDQVVAAQPRYAAEQAAWGNQLGVRFHLTFALAHCPDMLDAFRREPGLASMLPLIESFAEVQRVDPGFCARMKKVAMLENSDADEAWKSLEETPPAARWHPLFSLRRAGLLGEDRDFRRVLPIYEELCRDWPMDAAGFANTVHALLKLDQPEDAAVALERAPECYRRFRLYRTQQAAIAREPDAFHPPKPFRGQRDLGGLLLPEPPSIIDPDETARLDVGTLGARRGQE